MYELVGEYNNDEFLSLLTQLKLTEKCSNNDQLRKQYSQLKYYSEKHDLKFAVYREDMCHVIFLMVRAILISGNRHVYPKQMSISSDQILAVCGDIGEFIVWTK
jgi:hypothetical protein